MNLYRHGKLLRPLCGAHAVLLALPALLCSPLLCAREDVFTVRMTGTADGVGAGARKLAVEDAQQQVLAEVLKSMANTDDLAPFRGIMRLASGYIRQYDLLRCDTAAGQTHVEIDAQVLERPLRQDVAAVMLPRLARRPDILLLLAEAPAGADVPPVLRDGPAAAALRAGLEKFSFTVTGAEALELVYPPQQLLETVRGGVETGGRFARENLQDVVITGEAGVSREPVAQGSNMLRHRASVVLRIFSGADGKMCEVLSSEAVVQGVDPAEGGAQAISDAAEKLIGDTTVAVVLAMLERQNRDRVLVSVEASGHPGLTLELAAAMDGFPGVEGAEVLLDAPTLGRIALDYTGAMAGLADYLHTLRVGGGKVDIRRVVGREMTLAVAPPEEP
ncbi:MAG: hypothetical protein H3C30_15540 [Candidatus Hydrogenedentes bacterium]|nr:hypothetical protein [Candidatus Hydrogenedentota bacterium]